MMHGISDQEWSDYFDQQLEPGECDRIEAHLIGCLTCWEFYERMAQTTERLRAGGAEMRHRFPLRDEQLHAGLRGVFARIREAEASRTLPHRNSIQERLDFLEAIMAPMCGSRTAAKALHAAAKGSPAQSLAQVTPDNWTPFLTSLTSIATVMCGETGAHLVWESGQLR